MAYPCTNDPAEVLAAVNRVYHATEEVEDAVGAVESGLNAVTAAAEQKVDSIVAVAEVNANKFDKFVNGSDTQTVQLGSGDPTPVVRNVVRQLKADANWLKQFVANAPEGDVSLNNVTALYSAESRLLADRFADWINVKDYGATGDGGTDDTASLEAAFTAAELYSKGVVFPQGTYLTSGFTIPERCSVFAADAVFRVPEFSGDTTFITVGENAVIDKISVVSPEQENWTVFVYVNSGAKIGQVFLKSIGSVQIRGEGVFTEGQDVSIGYIETEHFDYSINAIKENGDYATGLSIGAVYSSYFKRAVRFAHQKNIKIGPCFICNGQGLETPGYIGYLIEGVSDAQFGDIYVEGSGETAVRIGGSNFGGKTQRLSFGNIYAYRCGGNAFKINPTVEASSGVTETADNITIDAVFGVDVSNGDYDNNSNLLRLSHCRNVTIGTCRSAVQSKEYSCQYGVTLNDVDGLTIESFYVQKPQAGWISFGTYDTDDVSYFSGDIKNVFINSAIVDETNGNNLIAVYTNETQEIGFIYIRNIVCKQAPARFLVFGNTVNIVDKFFISGEVESSAENLFYNCNDDNVYLDITVDKKRFIGNPKNFRHTASLTVSTDRFSPASGGPTGLFLQDTNIQGAANNGYGSALEFSRIGSYERGAAIAYKQTGNIYRQGGLSFSVVNAEEGEEDLREHLILRTDGALIPGATEEQYLGASNARWDTFYVASGGINESDERAKDYVESATERLLDAWSHVDFKVFKFKNAIEKKGADAARKHAGVIAQQIESAFASEGLDATEYGVLCHDEWAGEDGREKDLYGVRYDEALCLEAAYQRRRADRLESRIADLEARLASIEVQ